MKKTIYISRLSKNVKAEHLIMLFSSLGRVYQARVIPQMSNENFNYGFIEVEESLVRTILSKTYELDGYKLIVKESTGEPSMRSKAIDLYKKETYRKQIRKKNRNKISKD